MSKRKRTALLLVGLTLAILLLAVLALEVVFSSAWLRRKLEEKVAASLHATLTIDTFSFSPLRGRASATGVRLKREGVKSDLDVAIESVEMRIRVLPLLRRSVELTRVEFTRPKIRVLVRREPRAKAGGILNKAAAYAKKKLAGRPAPSEHRPARARLYVEQLFIRDGTIEYTATREGSDPFKATVSALEYSASDVSLDSFYHLAYGADARCDVTMGTTARLEKSGSTVPSTFSLTGVDLPYGSRYFDLTEAITITGGVLDVGYLIDKGTSALVRVQIRGLKLAANPAIADRKILFVPVEHIVRYVNQSPGNLSLEFGFGDGIHAGAEIDTITEEFWEEMWGEILKRVVRRFSGP